MLVKFYLLIHPGHCFTSFLQKTLHSAVIALKKDNSPFNCPILNSCSLKTVSSIDVYLNLADCNLHYSLMCSLNFVHIVRIVRLILHFILCNYMFYYCIQYCNSVRMTCSIKRLLILLILSHSICLAVGRLNSLH